jgi:hypothetical protein
VTVSLRTTILPGCRTRDAERTVSAACAPLGRLLRQAGAALVGFGGRPVGRARTLTFRHVFAAAFAILVLLYLLVLLVEPTGAGRSGR